MGKVLHPERLRGVDGRLIFFVHEAANCLSFDVMVVAGRRTEDEQRALYAKGRTEAGKVVTNAEHAQDTPHGRGAAVDLVPVVNGVPRWDEPLYFQEMDAVAKRNGLVWGGTFPGLEDSDHWQLPRWRDIPFDEFPTPVPTTLGESHEEPHE